jgi:hypothetical protein
MSRLALATVSGRQYREHFGGDPFNLAHAFGVSVVGLSREAAAVALSRSIRQSPAHDEVFHKAWASVYLGDAAGQSGRSGSTATAGASPSRPGPMKPDVDPYELGRGARRLWGGPWQAAVRLGVEVQYVPPGSLGGRRIGTADFKPYDRTASRIVKLDMGLAAFERELTLAHELAHIISDGQPRASLGFDEDDCEAYARGFMGLTREGRVPNAPAGRN